VRGSDATLSQSEAVSLREYFEQLLREYDLRYQQRFDASQEGIRQALQSAKEAVVKAETAMERRFDNTNEWRKTFEDLANRKLGRDEYMAAHEAVVEKIAVLEKRANMKEGTQAGMAVIITGLIAGAAAIVALISIFLHH
jgi:hypothetical protein